MKKVIRLGSLKVGGKNPIVIKGMIKTSLSMRSAVTKEAKSLQDEGAQAIRVAIKNPKDANIIRSLKKHIKVPLVADIHFQHKLALHAIDEGFDGIRLNPLNITKTEYIREVAKAAKAAKIPIRVGINSGGFTKKFSSDLAQAKAMVSETTKFIRVLEKGGFSDIMVSLKAANVATTVLANRSFSKKFDYPLHLGVTASGPFLEGLVKSSIGIGILLNEGIGSIIRVSLTAPSFWEIRAAKWILASLGMREHYPEIISCPMCSRCQVDLVRIVDSFYKEVQRLKTKGYNFPKRIAIMGCEVNGPGEGAQADIGIAFGKGRGIIFKKGRVIGVTSDKISTRALMQKMGVE